MKSLIINLPGMKPYFPPLGPASLVAYLKQQGVPNVSQRDLSIEFFQKISGADVLKKILDEYVHPEVSRLEVKGDISEIEEIIYAHALQLEFNIKHVMPHVDTLHSEIKSENTFKNFNELNSWSVNFTCLHYILSVIPEFIAMTYVSDPGDDEAKLIGGTNFLGRKDDCPQLEFMFREDSLRVLDESFLYEAFDDVLSEVCKDRNLQLIGLSFIYPEQGAYLPVLARWIKRKRPDIHISVGGAFISLIEDLISFNAFLFKDVDSYIPYEGELPFLKLIKSFESKARNLNIVPSLIYREGDGVRRNQFSDSMSLNDLPVPDYSDISVDDYYTPKPLIPIQTSRGCYWQKCAFCVHWHSNEKYRRRDTENVFRDMLSLNDSCGVEHFYLVDDSIHPNTMEEIANFNYMNFKWGGSARVELSLTNDSFVKCIRKGGCQSLFVGFESSNDRILKKMKKGVTREMQQLFVDCLFKNGINVFPLFFIGFPGERNAEAMETVDFAIRNRGKMTPSVVLETFVMCRRSPVCRSSSGISLNYDIENQCKLINNYSYSVSSGMGSKYSLRLRNKIHDKYLKAVSSVPEVMYLF
ncbi:MAG: radical SAM protein [Deltaproteobacteria bacterium]|jgi:anaerobic magnesium-protoporphyrin IX monomethyl ester cyclase|nr:radical SAM protein [Deltaproteobacteria bacterium]